MKKYDMLQVGLKYKEIEPLMGKLLEQYHETPEFIEEVRKLLIKCISDDDLPKAIAIIDWVEGNTSSLTGDDLVLIDDKVQQVISPEGEVIPVITIPAISTLAYTMGNEEFGFDLTGYCHDFDYVGKDDI